MTRRLLILSFLLFPLSGPLHAQVSPSDSVEAERKSFIDALRKRIAGNEEKPASEVFRNIKVFTRASAGRLLSIMEVGWSRSLGVSCTHCHVPGEWENDTKPQKQVAREMSAMVGTINGDLLKNIRNLRTSSPVINCTTCHRGQTQPALSLTGK